MIPVMCAKKNQHAELLVIRKWNHATGLINSYALLHAMLTLFLPQCPYVMTIQTTQRCYACL